MTRAPRRLVREKDVQKAVRAVLATVGFATYSLSQGRSTRQSPGLPDVYAIHPRHGALWVECKVAKGALRPHQVEFQRRCRAARIAHVVGGVQDVYRWLWVQGIFANTRSLADDFAAREVQAEVAL